MNVFEFAAKKKLRFSYKGTLATEDLFDLSLNDLNELYIKLAKTKKADAGDSLINPREDTVVTAQMEIVKSIFDAKTEAAAAARDRAARKIRRDAILEQINKKEFDVLANKSLTELKAELAAEAAADSVID